MNKKTISYLKEKWWYRLIKVIYIFLFICCIGASIVAAIDEFESDYIVISSFAFILFPILIYIGFEIIRRAFYYVIIGTIQPIDDNYFIKLKKYRSIIIVIVFILTIIFAYGIWDVNRVDRQKEKIENSIDQADQQELKTRKIRKLKIRK